MRFTLIALGIGFVLALALGGRPRNLAGRSFSWWLLLPAGLALQVVASQTHGSTAPLVLLLASYGCLVGFATANLRLTGMWMVVLGFLMNALVIGVNHGMPVRRSALRTVGVNASVQSVKHHAERPSDKLTFLADIIPVTPLGEVLSFGDVILAVGVIDVLVNLMRPPKRRERESDLARVLPPRDRLHISEPR
jgi:uncharacterized protein DUF5317